METKKVLGIIFSILFIGAFAFVLTWGIINFNKVKDGMSGTGVYTQEDVQNAYEDGYNTALSDKEGFEKLINSYRDTITTQSDQISQLNSEVAVLNNTNKDYKTQVTNLTAQRETLEEQVSVLNSIKTNNEATILDLNKQIAELSDRVIAYQSDKNKDLEQIEALNSQISNLQSLNTQLQNTNDLNVQTIASLNNQIATMNAQINELTYQMQNNSSVVNSLNAKIAELQKSVSYYEQYIANLESGEQVVATFEFAGSVYNIQIVNKNDIVTVTTPTSTAYVIFNGWTVDGSIVDLANYPIAANTKFVADVTYKYEVNFVVDGENYNNQLVVKDSNAIIPNDPAKAGYVFDYWTLDGVTFIDEASYPITQNTTFIAKFSKLHSVIFKYEDSTISTQTIKNGDLPQAVETVSTEFKVFNGWKVNDSIVDISTYKIVADTVFVADITYKYEVTFMNELDEHNNQIVEKGTYAQVPETPVKANYRFIGWSINGTDIVDVSNYKITENTTFTALFALDKLQVIFKNGNETLSTQQITNGSFATAPAIQNEKFKGWSVDGTNVVSVANYPITETTTFVALFGEFKLLSSEMVYFYGDSYSNGRIDVEVAGLKAGDVIHCNAPYILVKDGREFAGGGYNSWEGFEYYGSGGNFDGNDEWEELGGYGMYSILSDDYDYFGDGLELSSTTPYETVVGRVDWFDYNTMTIKIACYQDGILTVEWSDQANFYIEMMNIWYIAVLR